MKKITNEKGITLIALVVTIIILLILAAVSINLIFGNNGVIQRAKWASFATRLTGIEEKAMLTRNLEGDNLTGIDYSNTDVFDGLYDEENISGTLKRSIAAVREDNNEITQEQANTKYESYKDSDGKITDIYYVSAKIGEKSHKYIYDSKTNTAFQVVGEVIFGNVYHCYKGNPASTDPDKGNENDEENDDDDGIPDPDMPDPEPLQPDEIPIYTVEQYAKIASKEQGYVINDSKGQYVGTYNMDEDAKYKLMNDIDFKNINAESLRGFKGIFNGNSYTIKNITIDNKDKELSEDKKYYYYSADNLKTTQDDVGLPAGLFERTVGATIKNLRIDNATVSGNMNAGIIAGEIVQTNIEKCIIENSNVLTTGVPGNYGAMNGAVGGAVGWVYKQDGSKISEVKVDNTNVIGPGNTAGLVGMTTAPLQIELCKVKNSTVYMSWKDRYPGRNSGEAVAGILADSYDDTTITRCFVGKTIIKNDLTQLPGASTYGYTCGGILGAAGWYARNNINIEISDTHISDTSLAWGCNVGGIAGSIGNSTQELSLTDCTAKKIDTATGTAIGGILGYSYSKVTSLTNCDTDDFKVEGTLYGNCSQNFGGIVGFLMTGTASIQDCDASKINFSISGTTNGQKQVAGIIGASYGGGSWGSDKNGGITNCTFSDSQIKFDADESSVSFSSNAHLCGITGYNALDIYNCTVSGVKLLMVTETEVINGQNTKYWYNGVEGICGFSGCSRTVAGCKVLNSELRNEVGQTHGVCAYGYSGTVNVLGFNLENSKLYSLNFATGGFGYMSDADVNGFTIKNTDIISESFHAAGVTTYAMYSYDIQNVNIVNCNIGNNKFCDKTGYDDTSYNGCVGAIASVSSGATIKKCKVIDTKLTNHSRNTGGIVGYVSSSTPITECEVYNITINSEGRNVGGIVGNSQADIESCIVDGGTITTTRDGVGGIAGLAQGNLKNCNVKNLNISSTNGMIGGVVGCFPTWSSAGLTNCDVEKVNINTKGFMVGGIAGFYYKGYITECDVNSSKVISENYNVGGIAGIAYAMEGSINKCSVASSEVSGKDSNVGGIAGYYSASKNTAIITECTVSDSKVTETGADAVSVGGILGNGNNFDKTYSTIDTCTVSNTIVTGVDNVGGINGAVATEIIGCTVDKNSKITGRNKVGGIQGYSGTLGTISGQYDQYSSFQETVQQGSYSGTALDCGNISNCTVNGITIEGKSDINYIRGKNVGTTTETGCTNTSVTLNNL